MFKCFVLWSKKSFLIVFILFYFDLEETWWLYGKFYWMVKMIGFNQFILSCIRGRLVWSSVLLWWFGPEVVSFPEYLTLGWVCEGGTVEERWQCRGSQECIVNTGRKIPTHPRHSVDVCSLFFVSWCWTAQWKEPPDTESEVRVPPKKLLVLNSCCWPAKAPASVRRL